MGWFAKATSFLGSPTLKGLQFYSPSDAGVFGNIYQSKDFPNVFLGGKEDLDELEQKVGPVCRTIDVASVLPEYPVWNEEKISQTKPIFDRIVDEVSNIVRGTKCPVFVHCAMGMNRSAAVLSSAISKLTGRSVFDVLREMKSQRGNISPHDIYLYLAAESSGDKEKAESLGF